MPIVDSHCHAAPAWYEPIEVLLAQMERNGVDHAILIQMMGQYDNTYQFECLRRYPGRFASVVLIDPERPDAPDTLALLAAQGASGVRLRPTARSAGDDPLLIWRTAERFGLPVSCLGDPYVFAGDDFARVIEAVPKLKIVIEHLGEIGKLDPDDAATRDRIFALARYPNTYMKLPGLGEFARRAMPAREPLPFVEPVPTWLDAACAAFGAERLMWGSDYPPVSAREGYANALRWPMAHLAHRSEAERDAIFGNTALSVFSVR